MIALSTILRSNCCLLIVFFLFPSSVIYIRSTRQLQIVLLISFLFVLSYSFIRQLSLFHIIAGFPFLLFLYIQGSKFCPNDDGIFFQLFGCKGGKNIYSYIEEEYWNVRFLGYYSYNHVFVLLMIE